MCAKSMIREIPFGQRDDDLRENWVQSFQFFSAESLGGKFNLWEGESNFYEFFSFPCTHWFNVGWMFSHSSRW